MKNRERQREKTRKAAHAQQAKMAAIISNITPQLPKTQIEPLSQQQHHPGNRLRRMLWGAVIAICTLVGGISAAVTFYPRITVTISDPVDSNDPFSSSVTIMNSGYLPLHSVSPMLGLKEITFTNRAPITGDKNYRSELFCGDCWYPRDLSPNAGFMVALNDIFSLIDGKTPQTANSALLNTANISINVHYQTPLLHINGVKIFPFSAKKQSNGNFYWYANVPPN